MQNNRLNQMQFLRTLAFFSIFMRHANQWNFFHYPDWFGSVSATSFFFMLSGFLTGYSFHESKVRPGWNAYRKYMCRKIAQFYPLYLVVTLYAVIFSPVPQLFANGRFGELIPHVLQLFRNMLCIQAWSADGCFSYYGPAWFSSALLFLTALNVPFFFLLKSIRQRRGKNALLLLLAAACYGGTFAYSYWTRSGALYFLHYVFPPSRLGAYFGSMALGVLVRPCAERLRSGKKQTALFTLLEAGALFFWFASLKYPFAEWMNLNAAWLLPNAVVLLAFSVGSGLLSRLFSCKPLVCIGGVTMECYLVHALIIQTFSQNHTFDAAHTLGSLVSLAACLALTYLTAFFIQKCSRKPA